MLRKVVTLLRHVVPAPRCCARFFAGLVALFGIGAVVALFPGASEARYASLVMDVRTGEVLRARHADVQRYPASLTKIMTLYMVFEALDTGRWSLKTRLKVSRTAAGRPQTRLGLKAGQTIAVKDAIRALVVRSANDVATVVAENHSGTESRFARRMTERARALGMSRTTFRNASGLPDRRQKSTARDMARLAIMIQRHYPQYYRYFRHKTFKYRGRTYKNHNRLLKSYSGTDGIKTGYIRASGFNLVTSVRRNGHHLVGVVFGGKTPQRRNSHMVKILNEGFHAAATVAARRGVPLPVVRPTGPRPAEPLLVAAAPAPGVPDVVLPVTRPRVASGAGFAAGVVLPVLRPAPPVVVADGPVFSGRRWAIQVGAYSSAVKAHAVVAMARLVLGEDARPSRFRVDKVVRDHGPIYRARIIGLRESEARGICALLKTRQLPCAALPGDGVTIAAAPAD